MRVLSWNIHCLRGGSRARVAAIADAIARHTPDAVALQEVCADEDFVATIREELRKRGFTGFHFGAPLPGARKRYGNVIASTGTATPRLRATSATAENLDWCHLITSADVTTPDGFAFEFFSVHIPNGSGNGWAKIDAFDDLAEALGARPEARRIVAGDFNEPWRFTGELAESFARRDGVDLDAPFPRNGKHTSFDPRPRREWQDAVARVLDANSALGVNRFLPLDGSNAVASHVTRDGKQRLFDHILGSRHFKCSGVAYDHTIREAESSQRLSDHSIVFGDITLASDLGSRDVAPRVV